ncbi:MAG TPA: DUF3142 domain-containing protein [Blastocatellia bacterium]|nr:DUF3142 domain-containing protein [Blastocatellia bacterium]
MSDYLKNFGLLFAVMCGLPLLHAAITAPRTWATVETPVAFWAWRAQAPTAAEVEQVKRQTGARLLFLRAGQLDYEQGRLRRIRAIGGKLPNSIEIHLVYNATRDLLLGFEKVESAALAQIVSETFKTDIDRATQDGASVTGIQLDIDAPTRLLPRYAEALRLLRERIPQGFKLSITGLPTWMDSPKISALLDSVDFWTPQFYGAAIPNRVDKLIPISSPAAVRQAVVKARELDRPFYAGLAAYGYAVLYSPEGALIEARGDLDQSLIASHPQFELTESRPFDGRGASEWRYVYRALADVVIDGLVARRGDLLMLDAPSAATLRASARVVREEAGARLLGVCIFRLPGDDDPAALTADEIGAAINDRETTIATELKVERVPQSNDISPRRLAINVANIGTTGARLGEGAMNVELRLPAGSVSDVNSLSGFLDVETLCDNSTAGSPRACSLRRSNLLRLKARSWPPGARARAVISFASTLPIKVPARINIQANDGRAWQEEREMALNKE